MFRVFYVDMDKEVAEVHHFSSEDGTPAEAQRYQDCFAVGVYSTIYEDTDTDRIIGYPFYVHFKKLDKWSGADEQDLADFEAREVELDAIIRGVNMPLEVFQRAEVVAQTDAAFPNSVGKEVYSRLDQLRFDAAVKAIALGPGSGTLHRLEEAP